MTHRQLRVELSYLHLGQKCDFEIFVEKYAPFYCGSDTFYRIFQSLFSELTGLNLGEKYRISSLKESYVHENNRISIKNKNRISKNSQKISYLHGDTIFFEESYLHFLDTLIHVYNCQKQPKPVESRPFTVSPLQISCCNNEKLKNAKVFSRFPTQWRYDSLEIR